MDVISHIAQLRPRLAEERDVAFVPTMGSLHDGHLALMREARAHGHCVVASIFVNRLQFGPTEDFDRYPRTFETDCEKLRSAGVDVLFSPDESELYPEPQTFTVDPSELGNVLEGQFRPGFFRGVATVVLKLFNIVQPKAAVFGKKDYQQLMVVRHLVRQFALPIHIVAGDTTRASDGLALSSRNAYLSAPERAEAPRLFHVLKRIADGLQQGRGDYPQLEAEATEILKKNQWTVDYIAVRKQADLQWPAAMESSLVVLAAAWLGKTRLIDNLEVAR